VVALLADEDLDNHILRGLRRRAPNVDAVRVQDIELCGQPDEVVLAWAAQNSRLLVTHDAGTLVATAYERVRSGHSMPGVLVVPKYCDRGEIIEQLALIAECSDPAEWDKIIGLLPLR
jgi:hypothetical protein